MSPDPDLDLIVPIVVHVSKTFADLKCILAILENSPTLNDSLQSMTENEFLCLRACFVYKSMIGTCDDVSEINSLYDTGFADRWHHIHNNYSTDSIDSTNDIKELDIAKNAASTVEYDFQCLERVLSLVQNNSTLDDALKDMTYDEFACVSRCVRHYGNRYHLFGDYSTDYSTVCREMYNIQDKIRLSWYWQHEQIRATPLFSNT